MTSLRKLEEEAARCKDPEARKQLLQLIAERRQRKQQVWNEVKRTFESQPLTPEQERARERQAAQLRWALTIGVIVLWVVIIVLIWAIKTKPVDIS